MSQMAGQVRRIAVGLATLAFAIGSGFAAAPILAGSADDVALVRAAKAGDRETVERLLRERVDVNARSEDGMTALHWAVYGGDVELTRRLIAAGADVNLTNRYGAPPLATACARADATLVTTLLEAGSDANAAPAGEPVIMTASRTGIVEAVTALLTRGANVNATDTSKGQTPLMWAAAENHAPVVRVLLSKGADVRARSATGFTALMFAARQGHLASARLLVEAGANVNDRTPEGTPLLTLAVESLGTRPRSSCWNRARTRRQSPSARRPPCMCSSADALPHVVDDRSTISRAPPCWSTCSPKVRIRMRAPRRRPASPMRWWPAPCAQRLTTS